MPIQPETNEILSKICLNLVTTLHLRSYGRAGCAGCVWDALAERVLLRVRSAAVGPAASPAGPGEGRRVGDVRIAVSEGLLRKFFGPERWFESRKKMFSFGVEPFEMIIYTIYILLQRFRLTYFFGLHVVKLGGLNFQRLMNVSRNFKNMLRH